MMQVDVENVNTGEKATGKQIVGIVGLGLIGGSLGLDLRHRGWHVLGVSRSPLTCDLALERGAVDQASDQLSLLQEAGVIFICTPMAAITTTVRGLLPYITPKTILTDVGSVKEHILREVLPLWANFVGGHPMAGTTENGIMAAQEGLFINAPYILTPVENTPIAAVEVVANLVRSLGVRLYFTTPQEHDRAVSLISHLPVMISASLISTCSQEPHKSILSLAQNLASSGFRDTSRVGGGNPELGLMMAQYNRKALLDSLHKYQQNLQQVVTFLEMENWQDLQAILEKTQANRANFLT